MPSVCCAKNNLSRVSRFYVRLDTQYVILETSLSRQLTALVLTTEIKETEQHMHLKHKNKNVQN